MPRYFKLISILFVIIATIPAQVIAGGASVQSPGYHAYTEEDYRKINIILKYVAKPIGQEKIIYRYSSAKYIPKVTQDTPITQKEFEAYMLRDSPGVNNFARAGRGQYVSGNIFDSSSYAVRRSGGEAGLAKLKISKDVPFIDLNDPTTLAAMKEHNISKLDIYYLDPPVVVKGYNSNPKLDWYVVKAFDGIDYSPVTIEDLGGADPVAQGMLRSRLQNPSAKKIFDDQFKKLGLEPPSEVPYKSAKADSKGPVDKIKEKVARVKNEINQRIEKKAQTRESDERLKSSGQQALDKRQSLEKSFDGSLSREPSLAEVQSKANELAGNSGSPDAAKASVQEVQQSADRLSRTPSSVELAQKSTGAPAAPEASSGKDAASEGAAATDKTGVDASAPNKNLVSEPSEQKEAAIAEDQGGSRSEPQDQQVSERNGAPEEKVEDSARSPAANENSGEPGQNEGPRAANAPSEPEGGARNAGGAAEGRAAEGAENLENAANGVEETDRFKGLKSRIGPCFQAALLNFQVAQRGQSLKQQKITYAQAKLAVQGLVTQTQTPTSPSGSPSGGATGADSQAATSNRDSSFAAASAAQEQATACDQNPSSPVCTAIQSSFGPVERGVIAAAGGWSNVLNGLPPDVLAGIASGDSSAASAALMSHLPENTDPRIVQSLSYMAKMPRSEGAALAGVLKQNGINIFSATPPTTIAKKESSYADKKENLEKVVSKLKGNLAVIDPWISGAQAQSEKTPSKTAASSDVWHTGTDMNLFQIVSKRIVLSKSRVFIKP